MTRQIEVVDVPWSQVFIFLMERPDAEVIGRVGIATLENGLALTGLDSQGSYGVRFSWWESKECDP